jgi:hypothetical protein
MKTLTIMILALIIISPLHSQSLIEFQTGTHIEVQLGASITADSVIINGTYSGDGTINGSPIPVELISFTAGILENKVTLIWKTATEVNNSGFEIERMAQGAEIMSWEKITFVEGGGTTTEQQNYSFVDELNSSFKGKIQYRLKQIDFDGTFQYLTTVEIDVDLLPKEFALFQNYPNPFNPETTIRYQLPKNQFVMLKVYDLLGGEVAALVNEIQDAGSYNIIFDASKIPSGVYFYSIQAGDFKQIKKMILMK